MADAQAAGILWKFVFCPEPVQNFVPLGGGDRYEGYAAEGTELLKYIDDSQSPTSSLSRPTFTARW
jgi:hypothetical protein